MTYNEELEEPCPTCGAEAGKKCRTQRSNRTTDTHKARWLPIVERRKTKETDLFTRKEDSQS